MRDLPGAVLVSGGTEVVVGLTEGRLRPAHLVTLRRIAGLRGVLDEGGADEIVLGALTTYADLATVDVPLLTAMAPTVGSPASRNAGTLGGALGTASGAGDAVTALLALDASVDVVHVDGSRRVPVAAWLTGEGRCEGDVVRAVAIPRSHGSQHYLKAGERQAVFYGVASCALALDPVLRTVRCALGSVGPTPVRAAAAELLAGDRVVWGADRPRADSETCRLFGAAVADALEPPPPGLRVSGEHRRHVAGVLASRALARATATAA